MDSKKRIDSVTRTDSELRMVMDARYCHRFSSDDC